MPTNFSACFRPSLLPSIVMVLVGVLYLATSYSATATTGDFYECPKNLFTNQIDKAQAKRQGCTRVAPGRISQGGVNQDLEYAAPAIGSASAVMPAVTSAIAEAALRGSPTVAQPGPAPVAALPTVAPARPAAAATLQPDASSQRAAATSQRARDQDAQTILRAELAATQAALQALQRGPGPAQPAALARLRDDEAALRRELARLNP